MSAKLRLDARSEVSEEKYFSIAADDGKAIYCTMNTALVGSDRVIVIAHGLTGHANEAIHQTARRYFNAHGFDVVRMSFYCAEENARTLFDCTLDIHAQDMNTVVRHITPQYKKIYVIGHSYGGLTILFANPDVTAVSLWDSSFVPSFWASDAKYIPELDCYKIGWGTENLIGKAMYEEGINLGEQDAVALANALRPPAQVILAAESFENVNRHLLFQSLKVKKEEHDIVGADHCFNNGDTVFALLDKTTTWFNGF
jgi:pimeloyl-ACP methyl ester carboxylesterase